MRSEDPFPLAALPSRVRKAILQEFNGRWPSVHEIEQIPDKHWLAAPGIGPSALASIRSVMPHRQTAARPSSGMTDAELLERLVFIQEELIATCKALKKELSQTRSDRGRSEPVQDILQKSDV